MPAYALLGATGATGSSVLRCLLAEPPTGLSLHILVRSRSKLLNIFPKLAEQNGIHVRTAEGDISDSTALQRCLRGSDVVINCIGTNESKHDNTVIYDSAAAIVESLTALKTAEGEGYRAPVVLQLRGAPVNSYFSKQNPAPVRLILDFCLYFTYEDQRKATAFYEQVVVETPGLLDIIYIDPGALHDASGTERTGHKLFYQEKLNPMITYADLGAGICELAERREEFRGKGVGIGATGKVKMTWAALLGNLSGGLKNRLLFALGAI